MNASSPLNICKSQEPKFETNGHTERYHRVLILWLDLYKAMREAEPFVANDWRSHRVPWESRAAPVERAWRDLTSPANLLALEQWLCHSADGPPADWAREALRICRQRQPKP